MRLPALTDCIIRSRYKRFLADVEFADGRMETVHCPNTGAMSGCWRPGAPAQVSDSGNPKRKLRYTLERVDMGSGWVGVHTGRANPVIGEAIASGRLGTLVGYTRIGAEPRVALPSQPPSRFDWLLSDGPGVDAYVEVKNVTLLDGDVLRFPDAVTPRGRKHLELLTRVAARGQRGVVVFALNRPEGRRFEPAWEIDPDYGAALETAFARGVEIVVVRLSHTGTGIEVQGSVSWQRGH